MLKVQLRVSPTVHVVAEGETQMDVFQQIAEMQEVFGEQKCGKCGCTDLSYRVRKVPDGKKSEFSYPELVCQNKDCWAKLSFGQAKEDGKLFPVRFERDGKEYKKDANGKNIRRGSNGWVKFNKETNKEE
jgi:hypothetical protein